MFEIKIHATGSKGNAYSIIDGDHKILIDPGIRFRDLQKATNFGLAKYDFVLVSHEHKDHCISVKNLTRLGIPCLMSSGTAKELWLENVATHIKSEVQTERLSWRILPFAVQHDAAEPLGFLIQSPSGKKILYATDTYYIRYTFTGVTHWMIECNYSEDRLKTNEALPNDVKQRIRQSHFEFSRVKDFFRAMDLSKTEQIYLIHLSDDNSDAKRYVEEIEALTGKPVYPNRQEDSFHATAWKEMNWRVYD